VVHEYRLNYRCGLSIGAQEREENPALARVRGAAPHLTSRGMVPAVIGAGSLISDEHGLAVTPHEGAPLAPRAPRR